MRVTLAAAAIAAQGLAPACALLWGHPPPDYRATYIDHTMDCWLPEAAANFAARTIGEADAIVPQTLSPAAACALLPQGWNPADGWGVWSSGSLARILVPLRPGDRSATLHLRGYAPHRSQHVILAQAGFADRDITIPAGTAVAVALARESGSDLSRPAVIPIRLRIADVHDLLDTEIVDWRAIGVVLIEIVRHHDRADRQAGHDDDG